MPTNGIVSIVVPVVTALAVSALFRSAHRTPVVAPNGSMRLVYGRGMVVLGAFMLLIALTGVGFAVSSPSHDQGEVVAFIILAVGFGFGGIYLSAEALRSAVEVSPQGITSRSPWRRRPRAFRWEDVTTVRFSQMQGYVILEDRGGGKIRVSAMYTGFATFLGVLVERVGSHRVAEAVQQAREYLARMGRSASPAA